MTKPNLAVKMGRFTMPNPVTTGSGTFGSGTEIKDYLDLSRLGAITVKGITLEPRRGNPAPRICETPSGILNCIGLENPGVDGFIEETLPACDKYGAPIIVNISGNTEEDYAEVTRRLDKCDTVSAIEVNISCPNVKLGGMAFGTDPDSASEVIRAVRDNTDKTVIAKLSPNVTDIVLMAKAVEAAGADAISMINTLLGMKIDIKNKKPFLGNVMGGLSGPAIRPVGVRMVWQVSQAVNIPIIGMGGIVCWEDAIEFILAGATGVAVGTGNFRYPDTTIRVLDGITQYLIDNDYDDINDIIGLAWRK